MKDGYYLSTYLYINPLAFLCKGELRHDQNISLWKKASNKVELVHYWELERVTGLKQHGRAFYDKEQAVRLINYLLGRYNLSMDDMVEVWGTPELDTVTDYHCINDFRNFCYHNICHLFSSLLMDTELFRKENILCLAVDGAPDNLVDVNIETKKYYTGCYSVKGKIIDMFPVYSPGVLWNVAKKHYGLREGTLMALASASKSRLLDYKLENYLIQGVDDMAKVIDDLFKLFAYVDTLKEEDAGVLFNGFDGNFSNQDNKISMVMSEIQRRSIEIMEKNIDKAIERYDINPEETYLAISGGYGLNCPTNSYLMQKYQFKGFIAPPFVNDAGLSMGTALYAFYKKTGGNFEFKFETPYYGNQDDKFDVMIKKYKEFICSVSEIDYEKAIKDILEYPVVWYNGRSEVGPRALGNRSILADPRNEKSKQILNNIKKRQWWRPVAPIIMQEELNEWFEDAYPSPFMLHTFRLKESKAGIIPAVAHMDDSSRVQTISCRDNYLLYNLLKKMNEIYKVPILCNTSLNDIGEPIIDTIEEAINFILRKKIKVGYFNGYRIEFTKHQNYKETAPLKRVVDFDGYLDDDKRRMLLEEMNPFHLSDELLTVYIEHPRLYNKIDIRKEKDVLLLKRISQLRMSRFHML